MAELAQLGRRLPGAGRGFGVHDAQHFGSRFLQAFANLLKVENLAPRAINGGDHGPRPAGDVRHPLAEDAVNGNHHTIARFDQVDDAGFHPALPVPLTGNVRWLSV